MKGEVSGSPGSGLGDKGKRSKSEATPYFDGGVDGLGVKKGKAGSPDKAADLGRKGANKGGL